LPEALAPASIGEGLADASARLGRAGCDAPRLDAELLLARALGVERARLVIDGEAELSRVALARFEALLARRLQREPVAYILGRKEFRRISLQVDRRVLIPRPESELLVEAALGLPASTTAVDVGTGSGAVGLALKDERPDLEVLGTDINDEALAVARANARRLGLDVEFAQGDLLAGLRCQAVLANLPYVADGEPLAPEIERFEPTEALLGGPDGLGLIRRLVAVLPSDLSFVALEVGAGQADDVAALLAGAGFASLARLRDLAGHERVVVACR
jgi:release factor glutamine methyltransferase